MAVSVSLEEDEALVLFELLASARLEAVVESPERNALWALQAVLEKELVAPFSSEYSAKLEHARQSLLARYGS